MYKTEEGSFLPSVLPGVLRENDLFTTLPIETLWITCLLFIYFINPLKN